MKGIVSDKMKIGQKLGKRNCSNIRIATLENVPYVLCVQQIFKLDCACVQSDKSLCCPRKLNFGPLLSNECKSEDSDMTAWVHTLI